MSTGRRGTRTRATRTPAELAAYVTWDQVFAFRMRRQQLEPRSGKRAVDVVRQLCGVQAQVPVPREDLGDARHATRWRISARSSGERCASPSCGGNTARHAT